MEIFSGQICIRNPYRFMLIMIIIIINQKTKMRIKTTVWIFQETIKQNLTQENLDKKGKH